MLQTALRFNPDVFVDRLPKENHFWLQLSVFQGSSSHLLHETMRGIAYHPITTTLVSTGLTFRNYKLGEVDTTNVNLLLYWLVNDG